MWYGRAAAGVATLVWAAACLAQAPQGEAQDQLRPAPDVQTPRNNPGMPPPPPRDGSRFDMPFPPPVGEQPGQEGAWMGVQLVAVPRPLAAHLDTDDSGLMVINVVKGSPADKAGIERYDVITEADGKRVSGEVVKFVENIRNKKAGDEVTLLLYRHSKQTAVTVKVAESPKQPIELKYPEEWPDVLLQRNFGLRGKILRPGPNGWIWEDLENMPDFRDMLRDQMRNRWRQPFRGPASRPSAEIEARRVDKNGKTLQVRRLPDGSIEVRRSQSQGPPHTEVRTYKDMDALKAGDPEAAELLATLPAPENRPPRPPMLPKAPQMIPPPPPKPELAPPPAPPQAPAPLAPPQRAPRTQPARPLRAPREPRPGMQAPTPPPPAERTGPAEPMVSFDVEQDGSITVHTRQGDAELNTTFPSREAFKQKAPKLYERFEAMEESLK